MQIVEKTNISIRSYQNDEASVCIPNTYIAQLIVQALNATVEELFPLLQRSR